MIAKMLSGFAENSTQQARFLASVKLAESEEQDYKDDEWVGNVRRGRDSATAGRERTLDAAR